MGWVYKSGGRAPILETMTPVEWFFYGLAVVFLGLMFLFTILFYVAEGRAKRGEPGAAERYNRLLRGFPKGFYAKMLGKRPL